MVRHVQDDLVLRDQHTPTAVGVWTEGGIEVSCWRGNTCVLTSELESNPPTESVSRCGLTLPDAPPVDVDLDGVGGVSRLVIVDDEDITAQSVDPAGVHHCILGKHIVSLFLCGCSRTWSQNLPSRAAYLC